MINIQPQTEVRLLKTPIEKEGNHTLTFNNINSQTAYFLSKTIKSYTEFTYQRETETLVVPDSFDTINTCNYIMYKNGGFTNKYFYGFITKMEYVNENATRITFEIDSLQTWYFNINYKRCFVEREHVNNDTIGLHTVPENFELGDYIDQEVTSTEANSFNFLNVDGRAPLVVIACSDVNIPGFNPGLGRRYSNIFSGLIYLTFPNETSAETFMFHQDTKFGESPVVNIFMAPVPLANPTLTWRTCSDGDFSYNYNEVPYTTTASYMMSPSINKSNVLDSNYVPKNNKLLTWPFKYFVVSNNAGTSYDYKYELFSTNTCDFQINGAIGVGCSIKLQPNNYNYKSGLNPLYSLDAGKLPTCAWVNDSYTNYLTSNAVNLPLSILSDVTSMGISAGLGNPAGMTNAGMSIASTIGQVYSRSKVPLTAHGGANQGDFNYAWKLSFSVYKKSIKQEYANIIDSYFSAYGYKVNDVKVPNITGRANWNYVKTIGCNFTGDIPQEDIEKIRDLFNNGITFWHNEENFLNYSASNGII